MQRLHTGKWRVSMEEIAQELVKQKYERQRPYSSYQTYSR
ncbi:hypothetical protein NIES37_42340 [Tolypothrix tenuis PCC 7101]|uniref:Uncharacterized protein n=1 Tax=Tolypothrix tenuis PCC 7101 TaxID=231146 RepID=A0A1Z4N3J0_9CYAN|nr:hypothetical protein NIES37_42340 [Tolypothrix tenuis PCC 7101]BAZ75834.1 hypothetical protein NIES50_44250 [Aulosira laxa NIES-50]